MIRPSPPGLDQSDPERSFCKQRSSEVGEDVIIEDGQAAVVSETSVDRSEPGNWFISVNLITPRVVHKYIVTARLCLGTNKTKKLRDQVLHKQLFLTFQSGAGNSLTRERDKPTDRLHRQNYELRCYLFIIRVLRRRVVSGSLYANKPNRTHLKYDPIQRNIRYNE